MKAIGITLGDTEARQTFLEVSEILLIYVAIQVKITRIRACRERPDVSLSYANAVFRVNPPVVKRKQSQVIAQRVDSIGLCGLQRQRVLVRAKVDMILRGIQGRFPTETGQRDKNARLAIRGIRLLCLVGPVGGDEAPDLSFLPPDSALERTMWEKLVVDDNRLATNVPGIFAGGDFVAGPGMVIEAIAAGRRGAIAIDKYLKGDTSRVEIYDLKSNVIEEVVSTVEEEEGETWEPQFRVEIPRLPAEQRKRSFEETELCFPEEKARQEAKRCLRCDLEG